MPDRVGHRQDRQSKGEGHTEQANPDFREGGGEHGAPTPAEDEPEGPDELSGEPSVEWCHVRLLPIPRDTSDPPIVRTLRPPGAILVQAAAVCHAPDGTLTPLHSRPTLRLSQ